MSKVILITGASSGFGELMVKTLAPKGHTVYASMRNIDLKNKKKAEELDIWAKDNDYHLHVINLDVQKEKQVKKAIDQIMRNEGRIDVVVNNAGIGNYGTTEGYSDMQLQQIFDINVFGSMRVSRAALPYMREAGNGLIIQISSMLGRTVIPFMTTYCSTKFAVEALSEGLAEELKSTGVKIAVVQPGGYPTNFSNNSQKPEKDLMSEYGARAANFNKAMETYSKEMQSEKAPDPQEVADAVLTLVDGNYSRRIVCGATIEGIKEINDVSKKVQENLLKGFGLD